MSLEIRKEQRTITVYTASCTCGRSFHHPYKLTLLTNIRQHELRYHGEANEKRIKLEKAQRMLRKLENRLHGT